MAAGYKPVADDPNPAANRLHGRHLRRRSARPGRRAGHPRQLRLARHDRSVRRAGAGPPHHAADQPRLRPRPQPEDQHRRRAIEARHLARAARPIACAAPISTASAITGLHMHIGSGTDLEHLRQVCGAWKKRPATSAARITTISAGGGLPVPYRSGANLRRSGRLLQTLGRHAQAAGGRVRPQADAGDRAGPLPGRRERLPGQPRFAPSSRWATTRSICSTPASTIWPGRFCTAPIIRCRSCPRDGSGADRPLHDVVVGGPLCESGDIFTQEEGGFVCTRQLPAAEVGDYLVIEVRRRLRLRDGQQLQLQAAGRRSADRDGKPHLIRRRQTFDDLIRGEVIPPQ